MTKKNQQAFATQEEKKALLASLKTTMNDLGRLPGLIFAPIIAYVSAHYAKIPAERKGHLEKILEEIKAGGGEGVEKLKGWFHDMLHKNDKKKSSSKGGKNSKLPTPKKPLKKATKNSSFTEKVSNMGKSLSEKAKSASKKASETAKSATSSAKKSVAKSTKSHQSNQTKKKTITKPTTTTAKTSVRTKTTGASAKPTNHAGTKIAGTKKPTRTTTKPVNQGVKNTSTTKKLTTTTKKTSSTTKKTPINRPKK